VVRRRLDGASGTRSEFLISAVHLPDDLVQDSVWRKDLTMGILDSLENSPIFKGALGQLEAAVVPVVLSEVLGKGGQGGLSAIVAKLEQAGLGDQVKSWIGNGQNIPITAEQLQQVLGNETVKALAARFNIPIDQLAQILAQQLPAAVDHASPNGKLPHTA
jgi:uncharacterized protein YidB (DUF937 family)